MPKHVYEELPVEPGYRAPDFNLKDEKGRDVSLYGYIRDHLTVLVFVKGQDDRYTREQLDFLKDSIERIRFHNADVLVISSGDVSFNERLSDDMGLPFHILSDVDHAVMKRYDIYNAYDTLEGPVVFIINRIGMINFFYAGKNPEDIVEEADVIRMLHVLDADDTIIFGGIASRNM